MFFITNYNFRSEHLNCLCNNDMYKCFLQCATELILHVLTEASVKKKQANQRKCLKHSQTAEVCKKQRHCLIERLPHKFTGSIFLTELQMIAP